MDANAYWPILDELKIDGAIQNFLRDEMDGFTTWVENPYPPCMIPMWSCFGQVIVSYWRHWLDSESGSFVIFASESRQVREIALSVDQAKTYILFSVAGEEEELDDEFEHAARLLECAEADRIANFWEQYGCDYEGYLNENYCDQLPLPLCTDPSRYKGRMPFAPYGEDTLSSFCSFELEPSELVGVETQPIWLERDSVKRGFEDALEAGDLTSAWLCLCSSGWKALEAVEALKRLAALADNALLHSYAEVYGQHFETTRSPY